MSFGKCGWAAEDRGTTKQAVLPLDWTACVGSRKTGTNAVDASIHNT